jgi:hypothetical protein
MEVYSIITEYMEYQNLCRRHGSINFMAPNKFYEAFMSKAAKIEFFSA